MGLPMLKDYQKNQGGDDIDDDDEDEDDDNAVIADVGAFVPTRKMLKESGAAMVRSMLRSIPLRPEMDALQFSEVFRVLPVSNASRGGIIFKAHSYQKDVLRAISDPKWERVVMMFAAQTGKSEMLNNSIAYFMYLDPSEILMVLPTEEAAEEYVKRRIDPMIRDNPYLGNLVNSRDSRNNIMNKYFSGGSLSFVGSASPTKLASKPIRILICDEVDRYADTKEGSTLKLAQQRTTTFSRNRKIVLASTPTLKHRSPIEQEFLKTAMHYFEVPCQFCGKSQVLDFEHVIYTTHEDARYECLYCRAHWTELDKSRAVRQGKWVQHGTPRTKRAIGYFLNALYSPYVSMSEIVKEFMMISSERDRQVFENTVLCRTYEPVATNYEPEVLESRAENYTPDALPDGIQYVTCAVDVQENRLELEFRGWGQEKENWGIIYEVLQGDTFQEHVWRKLGEVLIKRINFSSKSGHNIPLVMTAIDTGYRPTNVHEFCKSFPPRSLRLVPIKGVSNPKESAYFKVQKTEYNRPMLIVNTYWCKHELYTYLLPVVMPGARYCHTPSAEYGYHPEYYKQLTAESLQTTTDPKTGIVKQEFVKTRTRNEALDIFVYNFAASEYFESRWRRVRTSN